MGDILPECLIQKILCFLSFKEAAKKSILSKIWLQAWLTLPNLKLGVSYFDEGVPIVDKVMERYRDEKIPIEKFELQNFARPYDTYPLIDKWLGIALENGVKYLVYRGFTYSSYSFPFFKFPAAKSLRELVLTGCALTNFSLSTSRVVKCHSLTKLSLSGGRLDENMLQSLLTSCPFIVNLIIDHCKILKKIELRNLPRIRSITIMINNRHQRVIIQAPTLEHLSYSGNSFEGLDNVECHNLKSLELSSWLISGFPEHLICTSQFLESLILKVRQGPERFYICRSLSLKHLKIQKDCGGGIRELIDAPNLVSLEYI